ncbi:beta and beta-prime subunits of DNA dependent RNA-polymerase [Fomitiporia mediterranea MF3/22]|uniref:beta and beta-prime subunits of DNA dependent RNA-polymerase n=1 Tax=Fomitiporia mediterranea (strain MF3/22) TaxID=694068 RepID=UPI000440945D|nr:beta and beta-prime subunits of DNA dependent RNA-polymerase [Fomitiporia mediterranea MF3/22]EJD01575.1 beta and beta-prime subunits of DNA dependent RNA-polymerase [Fomitiporia mediterranea MF3/22]
MNIAQPIPSTVQSISFSFLTSEDVRRISVKQITNPILLDELNRPTIGGLYDPALGPSDRKDICATCRLTHFTCPGHFGHIELPSPIFHPLFMVSMYKLLKGTCTFCHRFKIRRTELVKYVAKLRLLDHGLLDYANAIDEMKPNVSQNEDGSEDEDTAADESLEEFSRRVKMTTQLFLRMHPERKRDDYKDGLVFQARKDVIAEFLATTALKRCQNNDCKAFAHSLRKEGHTKIVELDLTTKQKAQHIQMNLRRNNILHQERHGRQSTQYADEDVSGSEESEGEGEAVFSDEEDGAEPEEKREALPKSASGKVKTMRGRNERIITPEECRAHLRRLFANEVSMCSLIFGRHGPFARVNTDRISPASADIFFMDCLLVSPTRFRPPAKMGDTLFEHPHNELLAKVLNTSYSLRDQADALRAANEKDSTVDEVSRRRMLGRLIESLVQLQVDVNSFIDSSKNPQRMRQGKLPPAGVKQNLEKKEGLFRMNMMGKRVNYSARSVISPDVNIDTNEIGVPPVFARKLTFPEPVTEHNVHLMRELVTNGHHKYPGASIIELEDGTKQSLEKMNVEERRALANQLLTPQNDLHGSSKMGLTTKTPAVNKKVYRHLRDGDVLILNRQPTLHKPSMMVHKARVLQGEKTIRMHYANCNSYNADFDGDEMNIHFPQNELARSEAMFIANTDNQYLVPTSGKPLRGLIQDHVVAGVWMTSRDTFFSREEYFQLLYGALRPEEQTDGRLRTLPPTIWKPVPLWTGKQIISTILLNITPSAAQGLNLTSKAKVSGDLWGKGSEEGRVVVMDGELLCGILDKSQFGATDYGLVHSCYELYGADIAGRLLGILSRLLTKFLQHRAFTCRMDDLTLTALGDSQRRSLLQKGKNLGQEGAEENFPSLATMPVSEKKGALRAFLRDVLRDDAKMAGLDVTVKKKLAGLTKSIADACMPHGLSRKFPHNHMQMMTQSGAKGSAVNAQQISCALGQQELEGRRVPVMISGKTLPSFKAFETAAIAGGYVASRFLTGVKPQEFYFHCMAGREGLIDTAVKTSRSGYLQRCLIKHLEGIRVHYDNTVRASDSSILQFHYGGDCLDVTRQKHLTQFEFAARNERSLVASLRTPSVDHFDDNEGAIKHMKDALKYLRKPKKGKKLDPAMSVYNPSRNIGATSEKFAQKVEEYIKSNPDHMLKDKNAEAPLWLSKSRKGISHKMFRMLMNVKYMRSMVDPGEAVGLLASQGVGEPSTQMTLNTFHFAGHGAANVTLGIPRLREIVMTASTKPKTPSMTMRVCAGADDKLIKSFCKRASRLALSQIVDKVEVNEKLARTRRRQFSVAISFYPKDEYREEYDLEPLEILPAFGVAFPQILRREIQLELKKLKADLRTHLSEVGRGRTEPQVGANPEGDEANANATAVNDDSSEIGDGDADAEKRARQTKQQATYESDEEEDSPSGEFDDAALEAEFNESADSPDSDDDAMDVDDLTEVDGQSIKDKISEVRNTFFLNLKSASSFKFSDSGVSFDLEFPSDQPKLLLVGLVEKACNKTIVREISGIADVFLSKDEGKDKQFKLVTNGSNFQGMWRFANAFEEESGEPVVELNDIYANDIYAGLVAYGVEMARALILKEIQNVFGAYNIDVDIRHLELIADYMTFDGGYKPFNRKGISTNPSPLLKASYETTAAFISDATLHGDFDDLRTPSGNIVLGRPSLSGTGVFDIVHSLH